MKMKIYTLSDPRNGEIKYIGKTKFSLSKRLSQHLCDKRTSKRCSWIKNLHNNNLIPIIELLAEVSDTNWREEEMFYIGYFKFLGFDLKNMTEGGDGIVFTEEIRDKIRK